MKYSAGNNVSWDFVDAFITFIFHNLTFHSEGEYSGGNNAQREYQC